MNVSFSSCRREPHPTDVLCLSERKIVTGVVTGIVTLALGIILASVFWQRGSFQILMTREGMAVVGLLLGGFAVASVSTVLMIISQSRHDTKVVTPTNNNKIALTNPSPHEFANAQSESREVFSGKNVTHLIPHKNHLIVTTQDDSQHQVVHVIDRASGSVICKEKKPTSSCAPLFLSNINKHSYLVTAFENKVTIFDITRKKKSADIGRDHNVTVIEFYKNVVVTNKQQQGYHNVLCLGYENGIIELIGFENYNIISHLTSGDSSPIHSIHYPETLTVKQQKYTSPLIFGTKNGIFFRDLTSKDTQHAISNVSGTNLVFGEATFASLEGRFKVHFWNFNDLTSSCIDYKNKLVEATCLAFNSSMVVTATKNNTFSIWDSFALHPINTFKDSEEDIQQIILFGSTVFTITKNGVFQWDFYKIPENQPEFGSKLVRNGSGENNNNG